MGDQLCLVIGVSSSFELATVLLTVGALLTTVLSTELATLAISMTLSCPLGTCRSSAGLPPQSPHQTDSGVPAPSRPRTGTLQGRAEEWGSRT